MDKYSLYLHKNHKDIDKHNVALFGEFNLSTGAIYTCTFCGKKVTLDESVSNRGHRLICTDCMYDVFGDFVNACKYLEGK